MPLTPLTGPIPGENYTSDTKNYPWHRPPEITDLDQGIEVCFKKLMSKNTAVSVFTMMEMGVNIATLTDMFVTSGIGAGKWTPDFALLLAGPVAHILYLMAKGYDMEPDLGIDNEINVPTNAFFSEVKKISEKKAQAATVGINVEDIKAEAGEQGNSEEPTETTEEAPVGLPKTGMMGSF